MGRPRCRYVERLHALRREYGRADEPFDILLALMDVPTVDLYKRAEDIGITAVMCAPWMGADGVDPADVNAVPRARSNASPRTSSPKCADARTVRASAATIRHDAGRTTTRATWSGYGPNPPDPRWPGGANIAVQFVLNYEEGGENNVLHGDPASGDVSVRNRWRTAISESTHEHGVAVRIRLAGRALAGAAGVRPARAAADRLRRGDGAGAQSRRPSPPSRRAATRSPATVCAGSATSSSTRTSSANTWPRRSR